MAAKEAAEFSVKAAPSASSSSFFSSKPSVKENNRALFYAAKNEDMEKLQASIAAGAEVNWANPEAVMSLTSLPTLFFFTPFFLSSVMHVIIVIHHRILCLLLRLLFLPV
jgi:hypothetical protein